MAKTTFEDIKKALWAGANTFRDNIDAANYKDYVLSMFLLNISAILMHKALMILKKNTKVFVSKDRLKTFLLYSNTNIPLITFWKTNMLLISETKSVKP